MKQKIALQSVLGISILGLLFSGYLTYTEVFKKTCALGLGTCTNVAGVPACVYGFIMYLIILIICIMGLRNKEEVVA